MTTQTLVLPCPTRPLLAVGGELKAAFCLARGHDAFLSQPFGDMASLEALALFEAAEREAERQFRLTPQIIACDLHPAYLSSRWAAAAAEVRGVPLIKVQHHHAHVAAVMAEHRQTDPVIGISLDGTGYGIDGAIWGGEVLVADYGSFTRAAHLKYAPLPGGDAAIRKPYRVALAHLWAAGIAWDADLPPMQACSLEEQRILRRQLERGINTVPTSSMGRLFDSAAALIGLRQIVTYEAQAAIELESCAAEIDDTPYAFGIESGEFPIQIDPAPVLAGLIADMRAGVSPALLSGRFHAAVADAIIRVAVLVRERTQINTAGLSGGVFQNVVLLKAIQQGLLAQGFAVLTHRQVPPNDGGLALGQAVIAATRLAEQ